MKYIFDRILLGVILLTIGVGYLGDQFHFWEFTMFFPGWWTFFITLPAISCIVKNGLHISSCFFTLLGLYLLADCNGWIGFHLSWTMIIAMICIYLGVKLLFRKKVTYYDYRFF